MGIFEPRDPLAVRRGWTISLRTALLATLAVLSIALVLALSIQRRRAYLFGRVNELEAEISKVDAEIRKAEAEDALYVGGLIKALIGARLQTLKQTRALLQQKADSGIFAIAVLYTIDGRPAVLPAHGADTGEAMREELRTLRERIRLQELEVNSYGGGLIRAIAASTLATMRQTEAMLEQRELALRYELPSYASPRQGGPAMSVADATAPETRAAAVVPTAPEESAQEAVSRLARGLDVTPTVRDSGPEGASSRSENEIFKVVSLETRVTETNDSWDRYAWRLTIKNFDDKPHLFDAMIEFHDAGGFIVDTDNKYNLFVPPFGEETFTDFDLVVADVRDKVARTEAKGPPETVTSL